MRILITGGGGFIGSRLARLLLQQGHSITIVDNFSPQIHGTNQELPSDLKEHVRLVVGDVRDEQVWRGVLPSQDCVVHLAAETGTGQSMYELSRYEQVNIAGTTHLYQLLTAGLAPDVQKIVVASSRAIYGEGAYECPEHGEIYPASRSTADKRLGLFDPVCPACGGPCVSIPTPERAPFQPSSFYGLTKQVQDQQVRMFSEVLGIPSVALRYQNVYGPGQSLKNPYTGILAIFSNLARAKRDINVFEDGEESRDFVYIDDIIQATATCVELPITGALALNVGSGERTSVFQVANLVNDFFGGLSKVNITGAFREGDIRHGMADLTQVSRTIGYSPQWKFRDGIRKFLEWASESEPELGGYERSLVEMKEKGLLHGE